MTNDHPPTCCYIEDQGAAKVAMSREAVHILACKASADYEIWMPPDPYETTFACSAHLEVMMPDRLCVVYSPGEAPCEILGIHPLVRLAEREGISPAAKIATTVAKAMAERGDNVGPNVTLVLLAELEARQVLLDSRDQRIKELENPPRTPSGYAQGAADANAYRELVHAVELEAASTAYWLEGFRCLPYDGRSRQRESP